MNELVLKCLVDKEASKSKRELKSFIKRMGTRYPCDFVIEEVDMSTFKWSDRVGRKYISDETMRDLTDPFKNDYEIDLVLLFIDDDNWKNGEQGLYGFQLGRIFNSFRTCTTKYRRYYERTAEHEILHALDNYILLYTGVRIAGLFGKKDFDNEIVHYEGYKNKKYDYKFVWDKVSPVLSLAIANRRKKKKDFVQSIKQTFTLPSHSTKEPISIWDQLLYFKKYEFKYPDKLDEQLLRSINKVRGIVGFPIKINSDWRSKGSHTSGVDLDIEINGGIFYELLKRIYKKGGGAMLWKVVNLIIKDDKFNSILKDDKQFIVTKACIEQGFTRIGLYDSHMHVGMKSDSPQNVVWTGISE